MKLLPKLFLLVLTLFVYLVNGQSQGVITGIVTSGADGAPLPGVTVLVPKTAAATVTDGEGKFSVRITKSVTQLQFSYTGFATQLVDVNNRSVIDVKMSVGGNPLSEVIVTALGVETQRKAIGYSAQVVEGKSLTEAREVNVANGLKGKVAGVHVNPSSGGAGASSFVIIRGNSSLTGDPQPLYVVDGIPIDNQTIDQPNIGNGRDFGDGIGNINPDDIENITVLKGPAAASLYGSRGANGVILVSTKKGRKGKGAMIDFNSNAVFEKPNVNPTKQNIWGGGYDDNYTSLNTVTIGGQQVIQWPNWLIDNWGGKMDGQPISVETWPELGLKPYTPRPVNNLQRFYNTGSTLTNTVGASGGDDKTVYRFSASDLHNEGIIPHQSLQRQTLDLRVSANVTPKLYIDAKINYIREKGENRPQNGINFTNVAADLNIIPNFIDLDWLKNYKRPDGSMVNWKAGSPYNPYWVVNEIKENDTRDRMIGFISAKYKFNDWLSLQGRTGTDFYTDVRFSSVGAGTPGSYLDGEVNSNQIRVKEENTDALLTASGKLSADFNGSFSVGANHRNHDEQFSGNEGIGLNVPGLYNISNAQLVIPRSYYSRKQINSVYYFGQLSYKGFLYLDITGRNDWSSTLGLNNQSFFYPSVSSSFIFTDAFAMKSKILSFGKLRASYAEAGNDAAPYQTTAGYNVNSSTNYNGQPFASIRDVIPALNLKNELTHSYEFGTELRFFENRLGIDVTYYNSSTTNQILHLGLAAPTGFSTAVINAGEIRNKGLEIFLTATAVKAGSFRWDISINFSHNRSEVVSLYPGVATLPLLNPGDAGIEARPGQPFGNIVGFKFLRNENGDILLDASGKWQRSADRVVLGNIQPDFLGGITNTFSYKGFSLSAMIDVRKGGQVYSYTKYDQMAKGTGKFTENRTNLIANGVIETSPGKYEKNDKVIVASDYYAGQGPWGGIDQTMVINADYVALREATLSYDLGSSLFKKTVFRTARLSVVGRNLFYLYRDPQFKLMDISPETAFSPTAAAQGFEARGIPTTRSLGLNLSFSF
jgi:TonB-linked SusC/RagA family outer membrane protein